MSSLRMGCGRHSPSKEGITMPDPSFPRCESGRALVLWIHEPCDPEGFCTLNKASLGISVSTVALIRAAACALILDLALAAARGGSLRACPLGLSIVGMCEAVVAALLAFAVLSERLAVSPTPAAGPQVGAPRAEQAAGGDGSLVGKNQ